MRGQYMSQHWATELQAFGTTGDERTFRLPWLRPECDALVNYKIGRGERPYTSRVGRHGIVVLQHGNRENVWIEEPRVDDILSAYLKDGGLAFMGVSTPGLTLERIIEQMGGLLSCAIFQNAGVRKTVETLAGGSNMPHAWIRQTIFRSLPTNAESKNNNREKFERILLSLVSSRVLRQGFELKCGHCGQRDWYHVGDLGEDFKCKKCFRAQQVPNLNKEQWRYVVDGLFRLKGKMSGCLTTILALLFLRYFVGHDVKYVPSFNYRDGTNHGERDFALFASELLRQDVDVIIGECKSENELERGQRDGIRNMGEQTGAYLAFCTLSHTYTADEKSYFEQGSSWPATDFANAKTPRNALSRSG
jgi:hypothetical protein